MFGSLRQRQLRCCALSVLAFISCQSLLLLLMQPEVARRSSADDHVIANESLAWQAFIAHTSARPNEYYQYNRELSDKVGALRVLPHTRDKSCERISYALPQPTKAKVSIVISFHNEARSMLLRTICSLVSRSPAGYLHELIIIDDYSEDVTLLSDLEALLNKLLATHEQLSLLYRRNVRRMGLIWSRNKGARLASGHYLLFLDSHCEVNAGWLEPLVHRLAQNAKRAVSPLLDRIDAETLTYCAGNAQLMGAFDWSLHFHWVTRQRPLSEQQPFDSPVFAGGIFMISRAWFLELLGFNQQLQIWGGESIEFAIKLWLCGGQIEIVPCSRIGHIFRARHAFEFPPVGGHALDSGQSTYLRNSKIIAESWLEEYKYLFYALKPAAIQIPLNYSDDELNLMKSQHRCRHFDWYLRFVHTELKLQHAEHSALGRLRNDARCLHVKQSQLLLTSCYKSDITQWHLHRDTGQLRTQAGHCLQVHLTVLQRHALFVSRCSNQTQWQRWQRRGTQLLHTYTHLCLDNALQDQVQLNECRYGAASQSFQFALEMERQPTHT